MKEENKKAEECQALFILLDKYSLGELEILTSKEIGKALEQGKKEADLYLGNCGLRGFYK